MFALGVEDVEGIFQIGVELVTAVEALCRGKTHVVGVEGIGHDQMRPDDAVRQIDGHPERQVVAVVVGVVQEAALFHKQPARIRAVAAGVPAFGMLRSEEHTSELQSLMRTSYAVFCLNKKKNKIQTDIT